MDNFTKKKLKKPKEIISDAKEGKFSLIKREFNLKKSKKTIKNMSEDGKELKSKIDELKEAHEKLIDRNSEEKKDFIKSKKPKKRL